MVETGVAQLALGLLCSLALAAKFAFQTRDLALENGRRITGLRVATKGRHGCRIQQKTGRIHTHLGKVQLPTPPVCQTSTAYLSLARFGRHGQWQARLARRRGRVGGGRDWPSSRQVAPPTLPSHSLRQQHVPLMVGARQCSPEEIVRIFAHKTPAGRQKDRVRLLVRTRFVGASSRFRHGFAKRLARLTLAG